ncbi:NAD(P)/FAD-dependent oxidoreductase [Cellulosimicrobium marinum]|uniref:NAD(P)/FAD-dependent oxidoreductase n=1 Tax=Cellulosimicrobium marinum TaxID=1638992 RepID=UPI001E63C18C|nr:FAD-dependent oxidoreductase [Cellulosimicrobium marinum]MCB7136279.1 FAD-dependent oxidoreductase [Cellulosimicrobium marinum]
MAGAPIVVVGGGLAAAKAVETLRDEGHDGVVVVVAREPHRPYERPPLSKDYLRGEAERDAVFPLAEDWYARHDVELLRGATATGVDPGGHVVTLADGRTLDYARLLIATGSDPRALPVPGADLEGVHYLRTLEDSERLAATFEASAREGAGRLAIVGDGWIGLEVAASARSKGLDVSVVGRGAHPLERVLGPEMGELYGQVHAEHGVHLHRRAEATEITGREDRVTGVALGDGTHVEADVVLVAVGAAPNVGLAEAAGLALDSATGGVVASATLQTTDPDVFVAGDVASVPSPRYGRSIRVEHWATALNQGPHAARAMLGSTDPYPELPYFFSDQYDVGMEYLGFVAGPDAYDEVVVSGSLADRELVAFWTKDGRVEAGMAVNVWDRMDDVTALIHRDGPVDRAELEAFVR